uniref:Transposase n=1 Tax=Haemonchus placei TaxID=6290 RepID=A0A0N4WHM2_HAEPC
MRCKWSVEYDTIPMRERRMRSGPPRLKFCLFDYREFISSIEQRISKERIREKPTGATMYLLGH